MSTTKSVINNAKEVMSIKIDFTFLYQFKKGMGADQFFVKRKARYYRGKAYCRGEWRMNPG